MENEKNVQKEIKDLLHELEKTDVIDSKGNPFVLLPKEQLEDLKKTIEEFSEELAPKLDNRK